MKKFFCLISLSIFLVFPCHASADSTSSRLSGRILLQVEEKGEAWYVDPENEKRYFLGRPSDAFQVMRERGVGISNENLLKIPVSLKYLSGEDSDGDGLPDNFERAIGTDPYSKDTSGNGYCDRTELENNYDPLTKTGRLPIDEDFAKRNKGKIFIQVEASGEAWYVNPDDGKRYFLARPEDAFKIMRKLGLGVKSEVLENIPIGGDFSPETTGPDADPPDIQGQDGYDLTQMEKDIHDLINQERLKHGLGELEWNSELADVARRHSEDLADQNSELTGEENACDLPFIHHEGTNFGLYNHDRLNDQGIYYFSQSAENLALLSGVVLSLRTTDSEERRVFENCYEQGSVLNDKFREDIGNIQSEEEKRERIAEEVEERKRILEDMEEMTVTKRVIKEEMELNRDMVEGWMNSPPHRKNILNDNFDQAGVGVAHVNGYVIATQSFIKKIECGYKEGPCCEKEGYHPYCYQNLDCEQGFCVSNSCCGV